MYLVDDDWVVLNVVVVGCRKGCRKRRSDDLWCWECILGVVKVLIW